MRVKNCAECKDDVPYGQVMFVVYWSVKSEDEPQLNFVCKGCAKSYVRENITPGGAL
jgi:hypothetical protein